MLLWRIFQLRRLNEQLRRKVACAARYGELWREVSAGNWNRVRYGLNA